MSLNSSPLRRTLIAVLVKYMLAGVALGVRLLRELLHTGESPLSVFPSSADELQLSKALRAAQLLDLQAS